MKDDNGDNMIKIQYIDFYNKYSAILWVILKIIISIKKRSLC